MVIGAPQATKRRKLILTPGKATEIIAKVRCHSLNNILDCYHAENLLPLQDMRITDETQILCRSQGIYKLRKQREQNDGAEKYFQKNRNHPIQVIPAYGEKVLTV